jgi:hypothetical protein
MLGFSVTLAAAAGLWTATIDPEWQFDSVRLTNGATFLGLITEESPRGIKFLVVRRNPGRPTICLPTSFRPSEIESVARLAEADRKRLGERLAEIARSGRDQEAQQQSLVLERDTDGVAGVWWRYRSDRFLLRSNASEEIVRRAAIRLEHVYAAYARYFPVRRPNAVPTSITVFGSRADYDRFLRAERRTFVNQAFYDPAAKRIVAASDLDRLGEDLERVRLQHKQLRIDLDRQQAALEKLFRGPELLRHIQPIRDTRRRIEHANAQNDLAFDRTTRTLFATLYHEAFHAYADSYVYPTDEAPLPRWLHEGLAQIFEGAIVEAGELRIGHVDADKLNRVKQFARKQELPGLEQLCRTNDRQFAVDHALSRADIYYLSAWAYAHWLMFDRRVTGTADMERYLSEIRMTDDALGATARLVGRAVHEADRAVLDYVGKLQPDGSLAEFTVTPGGR